MYCNDQTHCFVMSSITLASLQTNYISSDSYPKTDVIYMWRRAAEVQYEDYDIDSVHTYNCSSEYDIGVSA